ncbi:hypothetical protein B0I37DRAFT_381908 [Chaetomium sp. MPI-CAGE-AT-0009]|nr:hypothetical protein B0I37DRAFT_381908 [Chaetomium sp. MPI-CAGE-AT-0009]
MSIELTFDASISFGQRKTARLPRSGVPLDAYENEHYDFAALITAVADLYSQEDVLEMQGRQEVGKPLSAGAVSEVSSVHAAFTRPSTLVSHQTNTRKHVVVIKRSESKLFLPNGQHNDKAAIKSFISEIRILSHSSLRQHPNIIRILGVHWDYFQTGYPEPLILLEKANMDLRKFQAKNSSLPFATKKAIALDIAQGLSALHEAGVIHGDMKPANVLIFFKPELRAKLADFSHSLLDTGEQSQLVGGTWIYAAPEWKSPAPTSQLVKTDIYSLGLVLSGLISGSDLVTCIEKNDPLLGQGHSTTDRIQMLKDGDLMASYLYETMCLADQENPDLHLEDFPLIRSILDSTLQFDPTRRDLDRVIRLLGGRDYQVSSRPERLSDALESNALSIPYTALQDVSPIVTDQVVRALRIVAESEIDTRRAASSLELAICHLCDLGQNEAASYTQSSKRTALDYLLKSATLGDPWAQAMAHRIFQALQEEIPNEVPLRDWLYKAAVNGSRVALESLEQVDSSLHGDALETFRSTFCGNPEKYFINVPMNMDNDAANVVNDRGDTVLHWLASTGQTERLRSFTSTKLPAHVLNGQNHQGDTPLVCAVRAGHFHAMAELLSRNADAGIANSAGENGLHFLKSLDEAFVVQAAHMLAAARADRNAEATAYTGPTYLETKPIVKGCPRLRAVLSNRPDVLRVLLELDQLARQPGAANEPLIAASTQRLLLAWALRLHHLGILETLHECLSGSRVWAEMTRIRIWSDGMCQSLAELCIRGGVSRHATAGFDMPEKLVRLVNHGINHMGCLEGSLRFLKLLAPHTLEMSCGGARNALFFAIQEGRRDAACLLAAFETSDGGNLFTQSQSRAARLQDLGRHIRRIDKKPLLERARRARGLVSSISAKKPLNFLGALDTAKYGIEVDDTYTLASLPLSRKKRQRIMLDRYRGIRSHMRSSTFSSTDSSDEEDTEDSDSSDITQITIPDQPRVRRSSSVDSSWRRPAFPQQLPLNETGIEPAANAPSPAALEAGTQEVGATASHPVDYYSLGGYVDAILLSLLHGRRALFHDLLVGPGSNTIRVMPSFPCYVYLPSRRHHRAFFGPHRDFRAYFPRSSWNCVVTDVKLETAQAFTTFDGTLSYSLSYMTTIARSVHRDICLAHILLAAMAQANVPEPAGWATRSWFEEKCLSLDYSSVQSTPLFHAASLRWDELSILLLEHGASPQGTCFYGRSPQRSTVLARLIVATNNAQNEVQGLLTLAASRGLESIITPQDVGAIMGLDPHAAEYIQWDKGTLKWRYASRWCDDRDARLWQSITAADTSQRQKLRNSTSGFPNLVAEATSRRNVCAVDALLKLGLDQNTSGHSWSPFRPRVTALDLVSWTAYVGAAECDESGRELKERDAQLAALLRSRGGTRGLEYRVELQLLVNILQTFVFPVVGCGVLAYAIYSLGPLVSANWDRTLSLTEQCTTTTDSSGEKGIDTGAMIVFYGEKLVALCLELFTACEVAVALGAIPDMDDPHQSRQPRPEAIVLFLVVSVFLLILMIAGPCMGDESGAGKEALYHGLLFDATLGLFLALLIIALALFLSFLVGFWARRRLRWLGKNIQGGCPPSVVWRATYSTFKHPTMRLPSPFPRLVTQTARLWGVGKIKFGWGRGRRPMPASEVGLMHRHSWSEEPQGYVSQESNITSRQWRQHLSLGQLRLHVRNTLARFRFDVFQDRYQAARRIASSDWDDFGESDLLLGDTEG